MGIWFYDCDRGQGVIVADDYEQARREALLDAGRDAGVCNVHEASKSEIDFRRAMGGAIPAKSGNI